MRLPAIIRCIAVAAGSAGRCHPCANQGSFGALSHPLALLSHPSCDFNDLGTQGISLLAGYPTQLGTRFGYGYSYRVYEKVFGQGMGI